MSRHVANSDLLDLGLQVGEQVHEEDEEGTTRLSKRQQNQSMMDLQKGKLMLDQAEEMNQNEDMAEKINKSVLTPNMFGHQKSKRGNDSFVSSNPYIKFKKDHSDLTPNPAQSLRNQLKNSYKKQSRANNAKLI
jgi:hypothetical protein